LNASMLRHWLFEMGKVGFERHCSESLGVNLDPDLAQKNFLITGTSRGIGKACLKQIAEFGPARIYSSSRSELDYEVKQCEVHHHCADLASESSTAELARFIDKPLHCIVSNAGSMPLKLSKTGKQEELIYASQLLGPLRLLRDLKSQNKLAESFRFIFVSSGGQYLSFLPLSDMHYEKTDYDPLSAYARVKRMQVGILPHLQKIFPEAYFCAMHPGWVDTPGLRKSLKSFQKKNQAILRNSSQGADTISWLALRKENPAKTAFYMDRKEVDPELLPGLNHKPEDDAFYQELLQSLFPQKSF